MNFIVTVEDGQLDVRAAVSRKGPLERAMSFQSLRKPVDDNSHHVRIE